MIRAHLLKEWQTKALDPDHAAPQWLIDGAPAGIRAHPDDCGIFPVIDEETEIHFDEIFTDHSTFKNYNGVDNDPYACDEIIEHIAKGHMLEANSIEELKRVLGGEEPVLSKIGMLIKIKDGI